MRTYAVPPALFALVLLALASLACGNSGKRGGEGLSGELRVFAASSLTGAFEEAARRFEAIHPGVEVALNFASSSALATQVREGAPADVFASADLAQVEGLPAAARATEPMVFATNRPLVVVPSSASPVVSFEDLARPGVRLVLAARDVPIGRYAREMLARASGAPGGPGPDFATRVLANVRSEEANARAVLTKVQLGEADAGIVYATDAGAAGDSVRSIPIPEAFNVLAGYHIAILSGARNFELARAWLDFLTGAEGQAILAKHGFATP